jgi:ABC-type multidrug transport system ATPase subunit
MALLELERVTKSFPLVGRGAALGLTDVSLEIEAGELVAVLGPRASGRTTLLRLAGGLEAPDEGSVRFDGREVARERNALLGREIGFTQARFNIARGERVIEHVALAGHMQGDALAKARQRAWESLRRVGASDCAEFQPYQLDHAETTRVLLARTLMSNPRLILLDEPTRGVDLLARDGILTLVRSLANDGIAILMTVGESTEFAGATRALTLSDGELRGALMPSEADVLPLRAREA